MTENKIKNKITQRHWFFFWLMHQWTNLKMKVPLSSQLSFSIEHTFKPHPLMFFKTLAPLLSCPLDSYDNFLRQRLECFSSKVKTPKWVSFHLKLGSKSLLWPTSSDYLFCLSVKWIHHPDFLPHLTLAICFLTLSWTLHIFCVSLYFANPGSRVLVSGIYRTFYILACEEEGRGDIDLTLYF